MRNLNPNSRLNLSRRVESLRKLAHSLGLNPSRETLAKIVILQELLTTGLSPGKAIEAMRGEDEGLGWKNYYRYASLIYSDPRPLIPIEKEFTKHYTRLVDVEGLRTALNEIAKYAAHKILQKKAIQGTIKDYGKEWLQLCRDLIKIWIHEAAMNMLDQILDPLLMDSIRIEDFIVIIESNHALKRETHDE